jgi:ABC-type arginine transport system ATPase subunit
VSEVLARTPHIAPASPCFVIGVEHGVAAARADQLRAGPAVRKLADRFVREVLGANVPREDAAAAAVMAAWTVLGGDEPTDRYGAARR